MPALSRVCCQKGAGGKLRELDGTVHRCGTVWESGKLRDRHGFDRPSESQRRSSSIGPVLFRSSNCRTGEDRSRSRGIYSGISLANGTKAQSFSRIGDRQFRGSNLNARYVSRSKTSAWEERGPFGPGARSAALEDFFVELCRSHRSCGHIVGADMQTPPEQL